MAGMSRSKGARIEREIVHLHHDAGVPAEKRSRTGYAGADLRIADELTAEVKARAGGDGFVTLERWLGDCDVLFLRRDRQRPLVLLPWPVYVRLLMGYLRAPTLQEALYEPISPGQESVSPSRRPERASGRLARHTRPLARRSRPRRRCPHGRPSSV